MQILIYHKNCIYTRNHDYNNIFSKRTLKSKMNKFWKKKKEEKKEKIKMVPVIYAYIVCTIYVI